MSLFFYLQLPLSEGGLSASKRWLSYESLNKGTSHNPQANMTIDEDDEDDDSIMRDDSFDTLPMEAKLNVIH